MREQPLLFCLKCHNSSLPEFILHKLFPLKRQHFANRKGGILFLMKVSLPCQHINNEQRLNTQQDIKFSCKWSLFMLHSSQRTTACDAVSYWVTSPMKPGVALAPKILEPKKSPILIFCRQFSNIEAKLWFHFLSSRFLSHFCKYTS